MRIILSRKGFDSAYGGVPSPILPDGTLLSLPIPSAVSPVTYAELRLGGYWLGPVVQDLTRGKIRGGQGAHLDPDLRRDPLPRLPVWRPVFGQDGAALSHLRKCGVGPGDLFLFFGWFRRATVQDGHVRFIRGEPDLHVVFGWLQVDREVPLDAQWTEAPRWVRYHPHFHKQADGPNAVYIARRQLDLPSRPLSAPGAGCLRMCQSLQLTAPGATRSVWRLPRWFCPREGRNPLSYHLRPDRWRLDGDSVYLRSAHRGQEFVLDCDQYPEAVPWAESLVSSGMAEGALGPFVASHRHRRLRANR